MRFLTSIWMVLIIAVLMLSVRIVDPDVLKILRYKTWDYMQKLEPRPHTSNSIAIVNITEKDLETYGQWPWPRHIMAGLHNKLSVSGAVIVNYNVLFAENDRMSVNEYLKIFPMDESTRKTLLENLPDTDQVFAYTLSQFNNAVLMMSVKNEQGVNLPSTTPVITKGNVSQWLWKYAGIVSPTGKISSGTNGMGVNVTSPEPDTVVRKMPMVVQIGPKIYPSMILENIRLLNGSSKIKIVANENGIQDVLVSKKSGVPANKNAELYIRYAKPSSYVNLSVEQIMTNNFNEGKLKNKIVFIGLDAAGLSYLKDTPLGIMTDQLISAQALDTILTNNFLLRPSDAEIQEILAIGLLGLLLIIILPRQGVVWAIPTLVIAVSGLASISWFGFVQKGFLIDASFGILFIAVIWSHSVYNNFVTQNRLRQQIKKQFEHYLAPDMVKKLQKDPSLLKLGGETKNMTFMFSDIRGFTPISEKFKGNPEGLTKLINRFLTKMTDVIIRNGGTIDKFMGDCIMAFWNAPLDNPRHKELAVKTAMEMQKELAGLNKKLSAEGLPQINIGIGINSGQALVGNMGSEQRFDYSVIGDAVNVASRLESSSKTLGHVCVIGESTMKAVEKKFRFEFIDSILVKGKEEKLKVYTVKDIIN